MSPSRKGSPKILVCSVQRLFAQSLAAALRTRHAMTPFTVHLASGRGAAAAAGELLPHVVICDAWMPDMAMGELIVAITQAAPKAKVILISGHHSAEHIVGALAAGACAFLPSSVNVEKVAEAIERALAGESPVFARELIDMLATMGWRVEQSQHALDRLGPLSARERTVLGWLATGASADIIAERLFISPKTVKNHVQNILAKTGTGSRQEAVDLARASGLVAPSPSTQDFRPSG